MAGTSRGRAADLEAILEGRAVVYGRAGRGGELQSAVRDGLPVRSFDHVAATLDLSAAQLAELIGVAPRTLARRKHEKTLSAVESDRLVGVARIASLAEETLGTREHARGWLRDANRALGGVPPLKCLDTEPGRRRVEELLFQISHGIFS